MFISTPTSPASHHNHTYSCLAMSSRLSSPLAPKRQLKLTATSTVLFVIFFLALFVSSCEARRLRVRGGKASSSKSPPVLCKADGSRTNQMKDLSNADTAGACVAQADEKVNSKERVAMASPGAAGTTNVVRVSQRLSHRDLQGEGTAFHVDYAGPRTHPPSHN